MTCSKFGMKQECHGKRFKGLLYLTYQGHENMNTSDLNHVSASPRPFKTDNLIDMNPNPEDIYLQMVAITKKTEKLRKQTQAVLLKAMVEKERSELIREKIFLREVGYPV